MGRELLVRERSNIHLSASGEALLNYARSIVSNWENASQHLSMPHGIQTQVHVAGLPGIWDMVLQPWLTNALTEFPEVALCAEVLSEDTLLERLTNRSLDLAFTYDAPLSKYLNSTQFTELPLVLVSSERNQTLKSAMSEGYILVDWGAHFAVQHAKRFPDAPFSRLQTTQGRLAYEYIKSNGGAAYLAKPMVAKALAESELYTVQKAPEFNRAAYAIYHQKTEKTGLIQSLIDLF